MDFTVPTLQNTEFNVLVDQPQVTNFDLQVNKNDVRKFDVQNVGLNATMIKTPDVNFDLPQQQVTNINLEKLQSVQV